MVRKSPDLVGKLFGRLTVVSEGKIVETRQKDRVKRRYFWNCKCACGNETEVREDILKAGNTQSCGCLRDEVAVEIGKMYGDKARKRQPEDLTGREYGYLLVKGVAEPSFTPSGRKLVRWNCSCRCGKENIDVLGTSLRAGAATSCGCVSPVMIASGISSRQEWFIKLAKGVHGDTYSYENAVYKSSLEDITVTCSKHGDFSLRPNNHINGGGCQECAREGMYWRVIDRCLKDKEFSRRRGMLYLVKLSNAEEEFLKIGVSLDSKSRFAQYRADGFMVDVLNSWEADYMNVSLVEFAVIKYAQISGAIYYPKNVFAGHTECLSPDYLLDIENICNSLIRLDNLLNYMEEYV